MKRSITIPALAMSLIMLSTPVYAETAEVTAPAPESIDYSVQDNWAFWNYGEDKDADLFIVCPTVDMGKDGNYNADITNEKTKSKFVGALNMELGIYTDTAAVYSPYYRQATFPVYSLDKAEQEPYMQIAYNDVRDAFLYYSENCDESRPLILAGFSQGSDMVIRLMTEFFDDGKYSGRLVAAYAIGWSLTEEQTKQYPWLIPAQGETDTDVIVMFNSEAEHITSSLMVGENEHTYAINPLNWMTNSTPADKSLNKGACFTDYDGNITSEIPELTGAYIDEKRGTLKVPDINEADYPAAIFDEGIYHIYDYQFFYRNLQENVAKRTAAFIDDDKIIIGAEDYSIDLEVETDCTEACVGDSFKVIAKIRNSGDGDLTDIVLYFEDQVAYTKETLREGEGFGLEMTFYVTESDLGTDGIMNFHVTANEIPEPVSSSTSVKAVEKKPSPDESNPATGTDITVMMILCLGSLAAAGMTRAHSGKKNG